MNYIYTHTSARATALKQTLEDNKHMQALTELSQAYIPISNSKLSPAELSRASITNRVPHTAYIAINIFWQSIILNIKINL